MGFFRGCYTPEDYYLISLNFFYGTAFAFKDPIRTDFSREIVLMKNLVINSVFYSVLTAIVITEATAVLIVTRVGKQKK